MRATNILNISLVIVVAWLITANITAVRNNLKASTNLTATPLIVLINNLTDGALAQAYATKAELDPNILKNNLLLKDSLRTVRLIEAPTPAQGYLDSFVQQGDSSTISGWVYADEYSKQTQQYLVIEKAGEVVAVTRVNGFRPDVKKAIGKPMSELSGLSFKFENPDRLSKCDFKYYVLSQNLKIYPYTPCP